MSVQSFGPFRLDRSRRLLEKGGAPVSIGGRALDLLIALVDHAGQIVSGRALMGLVWPGLVVEEANLRVTISALRKVLGDGKDGARYIVNVMGRGYAFVAPLEAEAERAPAGFDRRGRLRRTHLFPEAPELPAARPDAIFYRPANDGQASRYRGRGRWYRTDTGRAGTRQW